MLERSIAGAERPSTEAAAGLLQGGCEAAAAWAFVSAMDVEGWKWFMLWSMEIEITWSVTHSAENSGGGGMVGSSLPKTAPPGAFEHAEVVTLEIDGGATGQNDGPPVVLREEPLNLSFAAIEMRHFFKIVDCDEVTCGWLIFAVSWIDLHAERYGPSMRQRPI